jgi:uncharacterized protein with GYD domain
MASYLMLFRFTTKGLEHIKESPARVDGIRQKFRKAGAEVKLFFGILGQYDTMFIVDAPNDETIARLAAMIGADGNVTSQTHRLFNDEEYRRIVAQL